MEFATGETRHDWHDHSCARVQLFIGAISKINEGVLLLPWRAKWTGLVSDFIVRHGPLTLAGPYPKNISLSPDFASDLVSARCCCCCWWWWWWLFLFYCKPEKENSPMSFTPSCHCHSRLLLSPPTHLPRNARSSMKANRDLLSPSADRRPRFPLRRQWQRELPFGTSAIADQYGSALTAAAPLKGDISVFLQTG